MGIDMTIKLLVTREKFDSVFSVDDWMNFYELTQKELYNLMLQFVVNEQEEYVSVEDARKLFKTVKKEEWGDYVSQFHSAITNAFVNPTNGSR